MWKPLRSVNLTPGPKAAHLLVTTTGSDRMKRGALMAVRMPKTIVTTMTVPEKAGKRATIRILIISLQTKTGLYNQHHPSGWCYYFPGSIAQTGKSFLYKTKEL